MNHTTGAQDTTLNHAESAAQNTLDYVKDLIATVEELDSKLDDWVEASGCDDSAELEDKLAEQEARIEELKRELDDAKSSRDT